MEQSLALLLNSVHSKTGKRKTALARRESGRLMPPHWLQM